MRKLMFLAFFGLVSAQVLAAEDEGWTTLCTKVGGALATLDADLKTQGITMATAKTSGQKIKLGLSKMGGNMMFVPLCGVAADLMMKSRQSKGASADDASRDIKLLLKCPGFVCTNLFSTFAALAPKIPTVGSILKPLLEMADKMLFAIYKKSPILVNLCATVVGEAYSKELTIKGRKMAPLWTDIDPMACIPAASKAVIDKRLQAAGAEPVPTVAPGVQVEDVPLPADAADIDF